ncbi:MAG: hypothetical protein ACK5FW_04820 [Acidimicrobiaceae bacterium]|jgi:hypothetical protein
MTTEFIIDGWSASGPDVTLHYHSGEISFAEHIQFPVDVETHHTVERLLDLLVIVAGVSYAKAVAPAVVRFPQIDISNAGYRLVEKTYNEGMREFAFHNGLPLTTAFVVADEPRGADFTIEALLHSPGIPLIPFGAGRDSCVVASALQHLQPTLFTIGLNPFAQRIADTLSLKLLTASRSLDPVLLKMNESGAPNGHIPVTAINSLLSLITAELTGHTSVVMANEKSASRPTRVKDGIEINHQFSKSLEFERVLGAAVDSAGSIVQYMSVLRDIPDHHISRAFATKCLDLHPLFMSCNQAMLRDDSKRSKGWCGQCPKCRGMFLSLAPYLSPAHITRIFGRDLLNDSTQISGFHELMTDDSKPFECVADVQEARDSMRQLLQSPAWSQHSVVMASRNLAEQPATRTDEEQGDWSNTTFDADIRAFLGQSA